MCICDSNTASRLGKLIFSSQMPQQSHQVEIAMHVRNREDACISEKFPITTWEESKGVDFVLIVGYLCR